MIVAPGTAVRYSRRSGFFVDPVVIAAAGVTLVGAAGLAFGTRLGPLVLVAAFVGGWSSAWSP